MQEGISVSITVVFLFLSASVPVMVFLSASAALANLSVAARQKRRVETWLGLALGIWVAVALALALGGVFEQQTLQGTPKDRFVALGLVAAGLFLLVLPAYRRTVLAIPQPLLIGAHGFRIAALALWVLVRAGLLPAAYLGPAVGDLVVGLSAIAVALWYRSRLPGSRLLAVLWNLLGVLDAVLAIRTTVLNPSPIRTMFPLVVPFLTAVPFLLLFHGYSLLGLIQKSRLPDQA